MMSKAIVWLRRRGLQTRVRVLVGPALVGLVAYASYAMTVAPTITWRNGGADGGDLAVAVMTAGIPHPPGYPTLMIVALGWTSLPLGGDIAHRLALMSAFGAAISVALTTATIRHLAGAPGSSWWIQIIASVYGGLALAWSPLLWSQATVAEVYAPGLVWISLIGLILLVGCRPLTVGRSSLAAFVGGLGFGALPQVVLAGPGALALVLLRFGPSATMRRAIILATVSAGAGLFTLLYLPLRAMADPVANWGDPSSVERFLALVTAAEYRYVLGMISPRDWLLRFREGLFQLGQNVTVAGVALALIGARAVWQRLRGEVVYLVSLLGLTLVARAAYPAAGNLVYLIPAVYATTILAGLGLAYLLVLSVRHAGRWLAMTITAGLASLVVWSALVTARQVDVSGDWTALMVAERLLDDAPPHALLLSRADETTFALWYVQAAGRRADVLVVDERLLVHPWYRGQLRRRDPEVGPSITEQQVGAPDRPRLVIVGSPDQSRLRPLD